MLLKLFFDGNSEMKRNATISVGDLLDGSVDGDFDGEIFQLTNSTDRPGKFCFFVENVASVFSDRHCVGHVYQP
jgi:hypothetical protein